MDPTKVVGGQCHNIDVETDDPYTVDVDPKIQFLQMFKSYDISFCLGPAKTRVPFIIDPPLRGYRALSLAILRQDPWMYSDL